MAVELSALTTCVFCGRDSNPDLPLVRITLGMPIEQPIQLFKKYISYLSWPKRIAMKCKQACYKLYQRKRLELAPLFIDRGGTAETQKRRNNT